MQDEGIDDGFSWGPPVVRLLEGIEDELSDLAGQHPIQGPKFVEGTRVMPSKIDPAMRSHAHGAPKGTVVALRRAEGRLDYVYDIQWDPIGALNTSNSWDSFVENDPEVADEEIDLLERDVPQHSLRRSKSSA